MPKVLTSWQKQEAEKVDEDEGGERGGGEEEEGRGEIPLLKTRDPHLAGGEQKKKVAETRRTSAIRSAHSCHMLPCSCYVVQIENSQVQYPRRGLRWRGFHSSGCEQPQVGINNRDHRCNGDL